MLRGVHTLVNGAVSLAIPPLCRGLDLQTEDVEEDYPWECLEPLPPLLTALSLYNILLISSIPPELARILSHNLRHLTLHNAYGVEYDFNPKDSRQVWTSFFELVPSTVTELHLRGTEDAIPNGALGALAQLVARLPKLTDFTLNRTMMHGLHEVVQALPRTSLRELDLAIADESMEGDGDDNYTQLAAAMPETVQTLRFDALCWPDRDALDVTHALIEQLPIATQTLDVSCDGAWDETHCRGFRFAPTLTNLSMHAGSTRGEDMAHLLARLPSSLTHITLSSMSLGGTPAIAALAEHMPPCLVALCLPSCGLTHHDLNVLSEDWPDTLQELNVKHNAFCPNRRVKKVPEQMSALLQDAKRIAWAESLPRNLRILNVKKMPVTHGIAASLVQRVLLSPPRELVTMYMSAGWVLEPALTVLRIAFNVHVK
ncbi:hypothetical protein GGF32_003662 [Allomyces javanicus]|nr:hypothetical protein GGF32_003662 [Allomyces javanicus]